MFLKKLAALLLGAMTALTASACQESGSLPSDAHGTIADSALTLTVFDVGKADAMVVQTEHSVTVIDTGNKGDGKKIEKFLEKQGIDTINTLIITHFDKDHVGGAARLANRLKIETVYVPNYQSASEEYLSFAEKAKETNLTITQMPMHSEQVWRADDAAFTLYAPNESFYGNNEENDFSLCLLLQHGKNTFLFAGDAEDARQKEIMSLNIGKVTFLKYPYHGNYLPTTEAFLDVFSPEMTVICCSKKEFAADSTVETLEKRGIETYYTNNGDLTVISDGKTLNCTQEQEKKK